MIEAVLHLAVNIDCCPFWHLSIDVFLSTWHTLCGQALTLTKSFTASTYFSCYILHLVYLAYKFLIKFDGRAWLYGWRVCMVWVEKYRRDWQEKDKRKRRNGLGWGWVMIVINFWHSALMSDTTLQYLTQTHSILCFSSVFYLNFYTSTRWWRGYQWCS